MSKFDKLYNKIICEMNEEIQPDEITIVKDAIDDEFIANGTILIDNWERLLPDLVQFVNNHIVFDNKFEDSATMLTIDYLDLVSILNKAIHELSLIKTF